MATKTTDNDIEYVLCDEDSRWGLCPRCRKNDGFLNLSRDHWFICHEHRLRWCAGANLFSCWRSETEVDWQANWDRIGDYKVLEHPPVSLEDWPPHEVGVPDAPPQGKKYDPLAARRKRAAAAIGGPARTAWEHGSVVSYPERCNLWGDARFRGNCDGRLLLNLVRLYRPRSVADPMSGSGTTGDVIEWMNRREAADIRFWGADLRTGFDLEHDDFPGHFDLVWVHPPYWDMIRYSDDPRDLSSEPDYSTFARRLEQCLVRCTAALTPGGRLAVLVGDVRRRGLYYPIVRDVLNMEPRLGQLRSVIVKVQHNCTSDGRSYRLEDARIQHEYCIVFKRAQAGRRGSRRGRVEGRRDR